MFFQKISGKFKETSALQWFEVEAGKLHSIMPIITFNRDDCIMKMKLLGPYYYLVTNTQNGKLHAICLFKNPSSEAGSAGKAGFPGVPGKPDC